MTTRNDRMEDLHPIAYAQFVRLAELLQDDYGAERTRTLFAVFETYRAPEAQERERLEGNSNARAWQSPHQYGLAVDFVPLLDGKWSWHPDHDYAWLKSRALSLGLDVPIVWDKVHVQHPAWNELKVRIRQMRK